MKAIILSKSDYKEKNVIYNAINENGIFSFQAKGAQSPNSPYVSLNIPLTVADIELSEDGRYKHKLLKNVTLLIGLVNGNDDLDKLLTISAIVELTSRCLDEEEAGALFTPLLQVVEALKLGKDPLLVTLIYVAKILKICGTELEVDKCVFCGSKEDIVNFSFAEGGFICRNCREEGMVSEFSPSQMKLIRYVFKSPDFTLKDSEKYTKEDKKYLLGKLNEFIDDYLGVNIKSLYTVVRDL